MKLLAIVLVLQVIGAIADELTQEEQEFHFYKEFLRYMDECGSKPYLLCFKENAFNYVQKLPNTIDIGDGIQIKPNEATRTSRQHEPIVLPDEPSAREETLDKVLTEKVSDYLSSHTLELKVPSDTINDLKMSVEEGRKKKKGKGGMGQLLMLFLLKAAALGAIAIKLLGLVAFKALLMAKIALTISGIIALKKLLEQKHHTSTYEVVAHPHYEDHDRSFSQELAYKGHEVSRSDSSTSSN